MLVPVTEILIKLDSLKDLTVIMKKIEVETERKLRHAGIASRV